MMIILDTNVVSDPISTRPNEHVIRWIDRQPSHTLYITSVTAAEMLAGIQKMAVGRRRTAISAAIEELVSKSFAGRMLNFDLAAARTYGLVFETLRTKGMNHDMADVQIAAIAKLHGAKVATRDMAPFIAAGVDVINPWTDE